MTSEPNGWLAKNSLRTFPFQEDQILTLFLGGVPVLEMEDDVILDLAITTALQINETDVSVVSVTRLELIGTVLTIGFSEIDLPFIEEIAEVAVDVAVTPPFTGVKLTTLRTGTHGVCVFGEGLFPFISKLGGGVYTMGETGWILEERAVRNNPFGRVTSISELGDPGTPLVGDVKLEEGYNLELVREDVTNSITINSFIGAGKGVFCGGPCPEPETCPEAVYTINGVPPNSNGNFTFSGQNYAIVTEGTNKVIIDTVVEVAKLCERTGSMGLDGPDGAAGPGGPGGGGPPKNCSPCIDCDEDCENPLKKNILNPPPGNEPGPGLGIEITDDPCDCN